MADLNVRAIYFESCHEDGFFQKFGRNQIDLEAFNRLINAITTYGENVESSRQIDRLVIACLIDMPYMIANAADHFRALGASPEVDLKRLSADLLDAMATMTGRGLNAYFEDFKELE